MQMLLRGHENDSQEEKQWWETKLPELCDLFMQYPMVCALEEDFKLEYIRKALDLNNWNKAQTARDLGVDARTIFRYIERFKELDG